jgi:redox-sensitive bicupin YhaK (pirin superfamily)
VPVPASTSAVELRPAGSRPATQLGWLDSKHSFSFGQHHDPANTHHGLLLVSNDDVVLPGTGFGTHPHRDMEIVTWVLDGSLVHQDSEGNKGVIYPRLAQRMSAGTGILHSEKNDAWTVLGGDDHRQPVRFIQMWVVPDERGIRPGYEQVELSEAELDGSLTVVASGMDRDAGARAVRIHNRYAALHAARLAPGEAVTVPDAPYVHVFAARGALDLEEAGSLHEGDAARLTAAGERRLRATEPAEVLVWEMHAGIAP